MTSKVRAASSVIRDSNYVVIQGWMLTRLGLKGNELMIYAVIYGFTQNGETEFVGSMKYLADWTNSTVESVRKCIKSLIDKGYIVKTLDGSGVNAYKAVLSAIYPHVDKNVDNSDSSAERPIQQSCMPIQQSCIDHATKLYDSCNKVVSTIQQSCINNYINNNNIDDKDTHTPPCGGERTDDAATDINVGRKPFPPCGGESADDAFEQLWELYPRARRQGKQTAKRAYMAALKRGVPAERIEAGLRRYADYVMRAQVEDRYVMQAATFFRGARWDDEYSTTAPRQQQSQRAQRANPALNYRQRTYTADQLRAMGVDLGDDMYDD